MGGLVKRATKLPKDNKKQNEVAKTQAVSLSERQEIIREVEEESVVAAWRSQNEGEEDMKFEDVTHNEEASEVATESLNEDGALWRAGRKAAAVEDTTGNRSMTQALRDQRREENVVDRSSKPCEDLGLEVKSVYLPSKGPIQAKLTKAEPPQPTLWLHHTLIVADPFILDKVRYLCLDRRMVQMLVQEHLRQYH